MTTPVWENLLDNMSTALYVIDCYGNVIFANSAMVRLSGYSRQELLSFNTYRLFEDGITSNHIFLRVFESKQKVISCQRFIKKNKAYSPYILVTQTPIFDERGEIKHVAASMQDVESINHMFQGIPKEDATIFETFTPPAVKRFIYQSPKMDQLLQSVNQIVSSDATVLILGESGTGKEVLAEYIHHNSPRSTSEMVAINCATLPEHLLEAELFGYEKGAFTGAQTTGKPGLIELANKSTFFLDEIDSLPLSLQGKLLRVIETRKVRRLGSVKSKFVDFRLLVATNANLLERVHNKEFRMDLFYRLSILPLNIPPLRERKEDIRPLSENFLQLYCYKYNRKKSFSDYLYVRLEAYDWPGNVRELKNFVERVVLMTDVSVTQIDDIAPGFLESLNIPLYAERGTPIQCQPDIGYDPMRTLKERVHEFEKQLISDALIHYGSISKAARALGIDRSTLIRKKGR